MNLHRSLAALAATVGMAILPTAASAAASPIPQAPVFPVVAKTLTLPFTLDGGGDVQVAVLTGDQTASDATWTTTASLDLAPYGGKDIRVLARKAGVTDPDSYFDATYKVRDTFPPGDKLGTDDNPDVSVFGNSPTYRGWATGWEDVAYGTNVVDSWKTPQNAVGPVGGVGYDGNMSVVVLGDHGHITMTFGSPIIDGAGADFAVFENGFRVSGGNSDFVELAYVEVSSNGTDFVRFDSGTTQTATVGAYAGTLASQFGGVAGRDLNGKGTPFDLRALKNKAAVRDGKVDLNKITRVRIVDIVGNGNDKDTFGHAIYDPFPTYGSGGFDLRGVGVFHQRDAGVQAPAATFTGPSSMTIASSVSPGTTGDQDVRLELANDADYANAQIVGSGSVGAADAYQSFSWTVNGLFSGKTYAYRVVATAADGTEVASAWKAFTKTPASIDAYNTPYLVRDGAGVKAYMSAIVSPNSDGDQKVRVEWGTDPDHHDTRLTDPQTLSGTPTTGQYGSAELGGLAQHATVHYRYILTRTNGTKVYGAWDSFTAEIDRGLSNLGTTLLTDTAAQISAQVQPGTSGDWTLHVDYGTDPDLASGVTSTPAQTVPGTEIDKTLVFDIPGLSEGNTYYYRLVYVNAGEGTITGGIRSFAPPGDVPSIQDPYVQSIVGTTANMVTTVIAGTWGPQTTHAELSSDEAHQDVVSTPDEVLGDQWNWPSYDLKDLIPGHDYWIRVVAKSASGRVTTSAWTAFTADALTDALGTPKVSDVGRDAAKVAVPVTPGHFDRAVAVEYTTDPAHADGVARTDPQTVAAGDGTTDATFALSGLEAGKAYAYRVVSTVAGLKEAGDWATFTTEKAPDDEPTVTTPTTPTTTTPTTTTPTTTTPSVPVGGAGTPATPMPTVVPSKTAPKLKVGLKPSGTARRGRTLSLALTLRNTGTGRAAPSTVCLTVPKGVAPYVRCLHVGAVKAGHARTRTFRLRLARGLSGTTVKVGVTAKATGVPTAKATLSLRLG